jgi:uncharacterized protein (DUF1778 family)
MLDDQVIVKLSKEDKAMVKEAAYINRISMSGFIRNAIIGAALQTTGGKK